MLVLGLLLVVGVVLALWWGGTAYRTWEPGAVEPGGPPEGRPSIRAVTLRYLRGVAIALVGGFWAGALVTGPAMRLIMRLLAVTAGDRAQGLITEADQMVGKISVDGTISLYLFGGILPGLLSGAIYVLFRRWLPGGRLGGVTFGLLLLVIAATRVDPLRPENLDFDIVGPGWLSAATFGLATLLHGMAVVAIANRYSRSFPPVAAGRSQRVRSLLPLALPALFLIPGVSLLVVSAAGLLVAIVSSQVPPLVRAVRSRAALVAGRVALVAVTVALAPGALLDLRDVVVRDRAAAAPDGGTGGWTGPAPPEA